MYVVQLNGFLVYLILCAITKITTPVIATNNHFEYRAILPINTVVRIAGKTTQIFGSFLPISMDLIHNDVAKINGHYSKGTCIKFVWVIIRISFCTIIFQRRKKISNSNF